MYFVVVDTRRFVKISRHLYCYRGCCNIYINTTQCFLVAQLTFLRDTKKNFSSWKYFCTFCKILQHYIVCERSFGQKNFKNIFSSFFIRKWNINDSVYSFFSLILPGRSNALSIISGRYSLRQPLLHLKSVSTPSNYVSTRKETTLERGLTR